MRRAIARSWNVPPWVVDESPVEEVQQELRILAIEAECGPTKGKTR